jgi:type IV pilus assembly protein PilB
MADNGATRDAKVASLMEREEEDLAEMLSGKYKVPYIDLSRLSISTEALRLVAESVARESEVAGFNLVGKKLSLAARAPQSSHLPPILDDLAKRGYAVTVFIVSRKSLERAWGYYKDISATTETKAGVFDISGEDIRNLAEELSSIEKLRTALSDVSQQKKAYRISHILEVVLAGSFAIDASDIHVEPEQNFVRLRYRLDGVLSDIAHFDTETYALLLSRIKLLSGLKLNITNQAQDGRFSVVLDNTEIEIRTSVIPGAYGESIVLRVLNPDAINVSFSDLGIEPKLLEILQREIRKPNGMLLNTGPTGSGKTTTLYSFLRDIHAPGVKIVTLEDPIEYHIEGIVQTQVDDTEYTFAKGLRSVLRQDPDVIMVGEIRDEEVAKTAIDAALTGHFVFSTLHTNTAAGSFPRLADFHIDMKVVGSAVSVVMAQRLVRKLCNACKKSIPLEGKNKERVEHIVAGIVDTAQVPEKRDTIFEAVGCEKCHGTGFKGRIGVFEAIVVDEEIDKAVRENPAERDIIAIQEKRDILTMAQDGILKILTGVSTLSELDRVIDIDSAAGA